MQMQMQIWPEKNVIEINCGIKIKVDVNVKSVMYMKKIIFGILLNLVVKWKIFSKSDALDKIIESCDEESKTIPTNCNENKANCKMQNLYNLLAFILITIALLIADSIQCYLLLSKKKHLLPFHFTKRIKRYYVLIRYYQYKNF